MTGDSSHIPPQENKGCLCPAGARSCLGTPGTPSFGTAWVASADRLAGAEQSSRDAQSSPLAATRSPKDRGHFFVCRFSLFLESRAQGILILQDI